MLYGPWRCLGFRDSPFTFMLRTLVRSSGGSAADGIFCAVFVGVNCYSTDGREGYTFVI